MSLVLASPYKRKSTSVPDPLWSKVVLLMHMESSAFADVKGHTVTAQQAIFFDTSKKKFGTGSARHTAPTAQTVGHLEITNTADLTPQAEFCMEAFWAIESVNGQGAVFLGKWGVGPSTNVDFITIVGSNGSIEWSGGGYGGVSAAGVFPIDGNFHHFAMDRYAGVISYYVDGVRVFQVNSPGVINNSGINLRTARWNSISGYTGWLDELRYTNGASRYRGAATITVPTVSFTDG